MEFDTPGSTPQHADGKTQPPPTPSHPRATNDRGFLAYCDFIDSYGARIRVIESSAASEPKVWIFTDDGDNAAAHAAHLNADQARTVRDALTAWLEL